MTTRHDGTIIYTPFPDYEVEDPSGSGANTTRTTYRIAGQIVAVQTKVGTQNGVFYYTYGDHLGNVVLLSYLGGTPIGTSLARYDPFGNYRTPPATTTNPAITSHGFTGHKHNNTGGYPTQNVGLIYMNARYYLPEIGRFISPDSIVPDPGNPQSYNRYAYVLNSPLNYSDPSGHRECGVSSSCTDPLPHDPAPTIQAGASPTPQISEQQFFYGLPVNQGSITLTNGFGPNNHAATYADPSSSKYNYTYMNSGGIHPGIDFFVPAGTVVISNVTGRVYIDMNPFPGDAEPNVVVLLSNGMYVVFGHVIRDTGLQDGQEIHLGDVIGVVQDQARNSHLHLALRDTGRAYNPLNFFDAPSALSELPWSGYVEGESLYSISSYSYGSAYNFWVDGPDMISVVR